MAIIRISGMICEKALFFKRHFTQPYFWNRFSSKSSEITAGIVIIGDEILNGHTRDTNTPFLIKKLNESGLKITKISVLPDDVDSIASEVSELSKKCTVVLTSGGIGPTHDDVTYEAVAKTCGESLVVNEELYKGFRDYFGSKADQNPAVIKLSSIPQSATLLFGTDKFGNRIKFPLISVKNIYMLPGVPSIIERAFDTFKSNFLLYNKPLQVKNIFLSLDEFSLTPILNETVKLFEGHIKFGSYPTFIENYYKVKLTLESVDKAWIDKAYSYLEQQLPPGSIVTLKENVLESATDKMFALTQNHSFLQTAVSVTEQTLEKYSSSEVCICFNGGKDCTALLHLVYCCVQKKNPKDWNNVLILYVKTGETFEEVDKFIESSVKTYNLNLVTINGNLKDSFQIFLQKYPKVKAVFMGSRRGDPGIENLDHVCQTDENWPSILRILPILNWSYSDVWVFIRSLQIPYCTLYDRGYTSLGTKSQTRQNPALLVAEIKGFRLYNPAYLLKDANDERNSRF
ncbi:FAD synthase [Trichonephila inaurata madagascariensis]|uniref:FAD synthase n=1 Tax=Trichonephila inaurata madagascariensis TaxID=2747483 RepID=A0A8X6JS36_9ARAC|nr:FAD synthase [Trichonephila inaurata madagascariensis]